MWGNGKEMESATGRGGGLRVGDSVLSVQGSGFRVEGL